MCILDHGKLRSWQTSYRGQIPNNYLDDLSEIIPERTRAWQESFKNSDDFLLVAKKAGTVVGFVSFGASRDNDAEKTRGEIYAIYILEEHKGIGIGQKLLDQAHLLLKEAKFVDSTLWVLESNLKTRAFYEKNKYYPDGVTKMSNIGGQDLRVIAH